MLAGAGLPGEQALPRFDETPAAEVTDGAAPGEPDGRLREPGRKPGEEPHEQVGRNRAGHARQHLWLGPHGNAHPGRSAAGEVVGAVQGRASRTDYENVSIPEWA